MAHNSDMYLQHAFQFRAKESPQETPPHPEKISIASYFILISIIHPLQMLQ